MAAHKPKKRPASKTKPPRKRAPSGAKPPLEKMDAAWQTLLEKALEKHRAGALRSGVKPIASKKARKPKKKNR